MDAATTVCLKHDEPLPVGRAHSKLGAIRSCSPTRHSSASKYSRCVLGKIHAKAARLELRFTCTGIFWRGSFCVIGNCQDASFLDAPWASIVLDRVPPPAATFDGSGPTIAVLLLGFMLTLLSKIGIVADEGSTPKLRASNLGRL